SQRRVTRRTRSTRRPRRLGRRSTHESRGSAGFLVCSLRDLRALRVLRVPPGQERRRVMNTARWSITAVTLTLTGALALDARQPAASAVSVDADDLGGLVSGSKGPEAGVWVIAETT